MTWYSLITLASLDVYIGKLTSAWEIRFKERLSGRSGKNNFTSQPSGNVSID